MNVMALSLFALNLLLASFLMSTLHVRGHAGMMQNGGARPAPRFLHWR
jgi:hypothetical protein